MIAAACGTRSPARLELGEVVTEPAAGQSRTAVARVEIRNAGAQDLLLHGVRLDCGCRLGSSLPDALAAGARAILVLLCRNGADATARPREIRLSSSDPARAEAVVRFTIPQLSRVAVEPAMLYFGYVPVGSSAARELTLPAGSETEDAAGADLPLVARDPELQIEQRPPRTDGRHVVRIRFTPRAAGPFRGALELRGGADAVPVSGVGYRSILAFPAELALPSELTAGAPAAIALKNVGAAPLEISAVDVPPGLAAELQTTTPGREFRLVVRARGRLDAEHAEIRLHTSAAEEPVVTIPVRDGSV
jgi:hypothetical protein